MGTPWLPRDPAPLHQAIGWSQPGAKVPEFSRKLPKTYEYLLLRRTGNRRRFSRGSFLGGCHKLRQFRSAPCWLLLKTKGYSGACFGVVFFFFLFVVAFAIVVAPLWNLSVSHPPLSLESFLRHRKLSITARSAGRSSLPGPYSVLKEKNKIKNQIALHLNTSFASHRKTP